MSRRKRESHQDPWEAGGDQPSYEDDPFAPGRTPQIDFMPRQVEYSTRGPRDWVISGPMLGASGPGRYFKSRALALEWAQEKYGQDRVQLLYPEREEHRWYILVKYRTPEQLKEARLERIREANRLRK